MKRPPYLCDKCSTELDYPYLYNMKGTEPDSSRFECAFSADLCKSCFWRVVNVMQHWMREDK